MKCCQSYFTSITPILWLGSLPIIAFFLIDHRKIAGRPKRKYCMPIEKSSLTAHETTAHCQRHYGSSSMRLRLVIYSQRGRSALPLRSSKNVLFPAWEYFIPNVGINAWVLCLISRSYWMIRIPYWIINGTYPIKFLHLSHQDARSPLDRGFPLISSLPWSLPPTLPYPSRLVQLRKAWGFLLWQAKKFERTMPTSWPTGMALRRKV